MNPSDERQRTMNEFYKNLTNEFCKYPILMDKRSRNQHRNKKAVQQVYKKIAKATGLQSEGVLKKKLEQMQNYAMGKIRGYFKNSLRFSTIDEAIKKIPVWMKLLEEPFGLIERSYNVVTAHTKAFNTRRYREIRLIIDLMQVIENQLKNASCPMEASKVLTSPDTISDFAKTVDVPVEKLHILWNNIYQQAKAKLYLYMEEGDNIDNKLGQVVRFTNVDKKVIDLGLLYDVRLRALQKGTSTSQKKLSSVILLFKLIVAAKKKYEMLLWERGERTLLKTNNGESVEMWAMVYFEYTRRGRWASPILLQRRWYELKQLARYRFLYAHRGTKAPPHILLLAIVRRFPYIVTESMPTWNELVRSNRVFMEWDFTHFNFDPEILMSEVPEDISETDLIDDLNDSDDDVEIIEKEPEIIEIDDPDDETPEKKDNDEVNIELLEKIDPDKAKVRIIFEDDEDIDKELESFQKESNDGLNNLKYYDIPIDEPEGGTRNISIGVSVKIENVGVEELDDFNKSDAERCDDSNTEIRSQGIDNKLIQLPRVVLTPLEDLYLWRKYSRNNSLNCRQLSVRKLAALVPITSDQLAKSRLYRNPMNITQIVARKTNNGIKHNKIQELNRIYYKFKSKRRFLTRSLKLSWTYFSATFWNERNIKLLECCQPVSVKLERVARNRKKVELPNIDEVRRINKMILTAQVAPLPVGPRAPENEITDLSDEIPSIDYVTKNSLPNMVWPTEQEVKDILRTYCTVINDMKVKGIPLHSTTSEESDNAVLIKNCIDLKLKIDRQLAEITDSIYNQKKLGSTTKKSSKKEDNNSKNLNTSETNVNSVDEWQRQKNQNLQYFNLKPGLHENRETLRTYNKSCLKRPSETIVAPKRSKTDDKEVIESKTADTAEQVNPDDSDDLVICETNATNVIELSDTDDDVTTPIETNQTNTASNININTSNVNVNENLSNLDIGDINKILNFIHKTGNENEANSKNSNVNIPVSPNTNVDITKNIPSLPPVPPLLYVIPPYVVNALNPDKNITPTNPNVSLPITSPSKINIRVVKNCFEIDGNQTEASTSQPVAESHNVLNLLSKVAYKIKGKTESPETDDPLGSRQFGRTKALKSISKIAMPNYLPLSGTPPSDTLYYVVKVPNKKYVPVRPSIPVIKNVRSISEVDHNKALINDVTQVTPTPHKDTDVTEGKGLDSEEVTDIDYNVATDLVNIEMNIPDSLDSDKNDSDEVNTDLCHKTNDDKAKDSIDDGEKLSDKSNDGKINDDVDGKDKEDNTEESIDLNRTGNVDPELSTDEANARKINLDEGKDKEDNTEESVVGSDLKITGNADSELCVDESNACKIDLAEDGDKEDNTEESIVGSDLNITGNADSELCVDESNACKIDLAEDGDKEDNTEESKVGSDINITKNDDSELCVDDSNACKINLAEGGDKEDSTEETLAR